MLLFFFQYNVIFIMGMYVQNSIKTVILLILIVSLASCGPMDTLFPSVSTYKVNFKINDTLISDYSFAGSKDAIRPFFEESVSDDPDVSALMVFMRDARGEVVGWRVIYKLEQEEAGDSSQTGGLLEDGAEQEEVNPEENLNEENNQTEEDNEEEKDEITDINETENDNETVKNTAASASSSTEAAASANAADYSTESFKHGDELVIPVKNLDDVLPSFPVPKGLVMGRYTLVSQVMSGRDILQRIEIPVFYLSDKNFSYNGINVHLPGIAENNQLIPRGTVIMLETMLDFDNNLDPYIVWYNGRRKIHEGKFSEGTGQFFWRAPEESGFFSFRAVIFPVENFQGLAGYQREVSLLVSSNPINIHLISENIPQLRHWYTFEANMNDLKMAASAERALVHLRNAPKWRAANGTYGVVTGHDNILTLPGISTSGNEDESWQALFRFRHINDGGILSILFGSSQNIFMHLSIENKNLVLTLTSPSETVSQTFDLTEKISEADTEQNIADPLNRNINEESPSGASVPPVSSANVSNSWAGENDFITVGISFSVKPEQISAQLNIVNNLIGNEQEAKPISIEVENERGFQVLLGFHRENPLSAENLSGQIQQTRRVRHESVVLWDEFALYYKPPMTILTNDINNIAGEEQLNPESDEFINASSSFESEVLPESLIEVVSADIST